MPRSFRKIDPGADILDAIRRCVSAGRRLELVSYHASKGDP